MMWIMICLFLVQASMQYFFAKWLGENDKKIILITFVSSLLSTILYFIFSIKLLSISIFLSLLCGHMIFLLLSIAFHFSLYVAIVDILLTTMIEFIFYPLSLLYLIYPQTWEYMTYIFVCIGSLCIAFVTSQDKTNIEENWAKHLKFIDYHLDIFVIVMIIVGLFLDILLLMTYHYSSIISNITLCIFLLIIPILTCIFIDVFIELYKTKQSEKILNTWQKESRDYMNVIRSQRHDFNFHLHAIVGLIENGEFKECQDYVANMVNEASSINDIMPVHDAVIGSMLYNMRETARQKGFDIEYDITYDMKDIICNSFECNKIIGNLIQNAIDAISSEEEKKYGIKVSILKRRGNTVINVSNCFQGNKDVILHAYDLGYSTKRQHEGIGLSMVMRTVEKYDGRIYTEFDGDIVRFIVNIPNLVHFEEGEHND